MYTVSITSQGQISIPAKVQKKLGLKKPGKVILKVEDGKIIVEPVKDFFELRGSLKTTKKPLTGEEIHERFALDRAEELARKYKWKK